MRIYRSTESSDLMTRITEVDETGRYESYVLWPDGEITTRFLSTVQEMGSPTVLQFLRHHPEFQRIRKDRE